MNRVNSACSPSNEKRRTFEVHSALRRRRVRAPEDLLTGVTERVRDAHRGGPTARARGFERVERFGLGLEIRAKPAKKYPSLVDQLRYTHLDLKLSDKLPVNSHGFFAELAQTRPRAGAVKSELADTERVLVIHVHRAANLVDPRNPTGYVAN